MQILATYTADMEIHEVNGHTLIGERAHTHPQAHINIVMAALALLTGSCSEGVVSSTEPYLPNASRDRIALLEAATAIQSEVSLSIFASDPLIGDAIHVLGRHTRKKAPDDGQTALVLQVDRMINEWVSMLAGRGPQLNALAELLVERGELPLAEIGERLGIESDC
jgi:hypothetical protein